jgi:hypothetical protein
MNLGFILQLIQAAGTKLPMIWPHILTIANAMKEILVIMGWSMVQVSVEDDADLDVSDALLAYSISEEEANEVLTTFNSIGHALSDASDAGDAEGSASE